MNYVEVEEETDEESDHETTQGKLRRIDSRWLEATQIDTQMQSTSFERNSDDAPGWNVCSYCMAAILH